MATEELGVPGGLKFLIFEGLRLVSGLCGGKNHQVPMTLQTAPAPQTRLQFIDAARAVAILLMLEGHFISFTLAPEWQSRGHPFYETWHYVRGMTAPMFFTVTGLVFAYLLSGAREPGFFGVRRVRRGFIRAGELLLWGYLLQLDVRHLGNLSNGHPDAWSGGFHVLQCIGVGLLGLLLIFGLLRRWGLLPLMIGYTTLALGMFLLEVVLSNHTGYVPAGAPAWLQNPLKGPLSNFPIAPWLGYTFYGAVLGVFVRIREGVTHPLLMLGVGLLLRGCGKWIDQGLAVLILNLTNTRMESAVIPTGFHMRVGEMLLVLGVLIWIEKRFHPLPARFLTVGRNTFFIYVAHTIVLYGAIFGIGLNQFWKEALNPWQAALGAVIFCGAFAWAAQGVEPAAKRWKKWRKRASGVHS